LQTFATEFNVYGELRYHFHQYFAFVGSLYRIFEGHKNGDVTSKISDPPFTKSCLKKWQQWRTHIHWMTFW